MRARDLILAIAIIALAACALAPSKQLPMSDDMSAPEPSLERIADGVWIHKSYKTLPPWGPFLSQGLVLDRGDSLILIDTAWTNADTKSLLTLIEHETGRRPDFAVVTHAHEDKMGGVAALRAAGVPTRAHPFTIEDARTRNLEAPRKTLLEDADLEALSDSGDVVAFYPGPGHTRDNIVVYDAPSSTLFAGCLIRPAGASDLGNTADADLSRWPATVRAVAEAFPDATVVIPSHGPMGGRELFGHMAKLFETPPVGG